MKALRLENLVSRKHFFEIEDQPWFPTRLRNYFTEFMQFVSDHFDMYKDAVPIIKKGLERSQDKQIIDMGSGAGGGWVKISERLRQESMEIPIILTDYYPNLPAFEKISQKSRGNIGFCQYSVDATSVPKELKGMRTMCQSFHHFNTEMAQKILQNAVDDNRVIAIFELQKRNLTSLLRTTLALIVVPLLTLSMRPLNLGRLLFTFVIPIIPFICFWDGTVSAFRTYSEKELRKLTQQIDAPHYIWEIGCTGSMPGGVLYLLGYPHTATNEKQGDISCK